MQWLLLCYDEWRYWAIFAAWVKKPRDRVIVNDYVVISDIHAYFQVLVVNISLEKIHKLTIFCTVYSGILLLNDLSFFIRTYKPGT